ncbi:multicopper oxidase [Colletotrichum musicola]|uniref:Multicopper oxidase n=1 Tax=Colletotrichum musicola TaxID=2175873 RepID=A0A8H6KQ26_9PEZI|nr:multicopper oxidase [Colletotrichum musicola]
MLSIRNAWLVATDVAHSLLSLGGEPRGVVSVRFGSSHVGAKTALAIRDQDHPYFNPGGTNDKGFMCDYPELKGWEYCGDKNSSCWLYNTANPEETYTIGTDYEKVMPVGVDRNYILYVNDGWINADGLNFTYAKLFNNTFPGPLIEACWGDRVHVTVINELQMNGTSVHWHGIKQKDTMHMDGVNGITQCPIAPKDRFTYSWNATQYGSSWYHSHYSVQYADGLQAPITIHGPTSAQYDEAIDPIIVTDWLHNSAFAALYVQVYERDILFGGPNNTVGDISRFNDALTPDLPVPKPYEIHFEPIGDNPDTKAKRYLLRVINTAWDSTFVFSIDNHYLEVVETDFVPVEKFTVTEVLVSIGQRYHLIVEAAPTCNTSDPETNPIPEDGNFWMRTWVSDGCYINGTTSNYMEMGILRYDKDSTADPTSRPWKVDLACSDLEINSKTKPIVPWTVGPPANGRVGEDFNISLLATGMEGPYGTAFISMDRGNSTEQNPFQTDYGNPTFLNLANVGGNWPKGWVVVPENYTDDSWVHLVLFGSENNQGPHPIHLHGHDFAIIQEVDGEFYSPETYDPSKNNLDNPPRRDVVLLPNKGYVVIAFKTDNPGVWLMHCHIAFHAAGGLSLQILERQKAANEIWPPGDSDALEEAYRVCANWNTWAYDCKNYWPGEVSRRYPNGTETGEMYWPACEDVVDLQNDSGV